MRRLEPLCTFRIGPARLGVGTGEVREVLDRSRPQPVPLTPEIVAGAIPYRGEILPVVNLHVMFGFRPAIFPSTLLVFACPDRHELYGIAVDTVEGITEPQPDSWQPNPSTLDPVSGRLFCGSFRDASGLIVRLAPFELAPTRLIQSEWGSRLSVPPQLEKECTR